MTISTLLQQLSTEFARFSDSPRLDAEVLLCHVLARPRSYLYTWPEQELKPAEQALLEQLAGRRRQGEPIAHIVGEREFWSLPLKVTAATLIPRPETELLVEAALARIPVQARWSLADLGTGSGAIALALASERPACRIHAVERSPEALAVAKENARVLGLENVEFHQGHWLTPLAGRHFEMILSNPPYICHDDPHLQQGDVRHEPFGALASGEDGLNDIREIIHAAPAHLSPAGWLLLEHGYDQGETVCALLKAAGFEQVSDLPDLQGHGRVGLGRWG
jgi:release factor glutamine methyltransferase